MDTRCDLKSGITPAVSASTVGLHLNNDSDVPTLSITAPSEEVSEIEDNLESSASQTPAHEETDEALVEAKKVVGEVLSMASEILQCQKPQQDVTWTLPVEEKDTEDEDDEVATVASVVEAGLRDRNLSEGDEEKVDTEIRTVATDFVKGLVEKACHEANKRMENSKDAHCHGNYSERFEMADAMSSGDPDKRRPWYRRARTSARKLLHRLCICGRSHR